VVGINAGPLAVGPITAAPIAWTPAGKNDWSISLVKTPGEIIFSAITCSSFYNQFLINISTNCQTIIFVV
jgi:hypothetical protein